MKGFNISEFPGAVIGKTTREAIAQSGSVSHTPAAEPLDVQILIAQVVARGYAEPQPEHYFHPLRKWRFDFAWPSLKVAFEREGGRFAPVSCTGCGKTRKVFVSRHHSHKGMEADTDKYNAAAILGWLVIRATPPMLKDGRAADSLLQALQLRGAWPKETRND